MKSGNTFSDVKLNEALPPHLAKLVDEKGNLKDPEKQKEFEKSRDKWKPKFTAKDVTPKGYGVKEETEQLDEAGTGHPVPGHDYHKKTDAELRFIARDAKEAEDAMSGHNPKAANKYADQKNDAATVLHFRKNGMPDWYKKKYGHLKEEVEQIEEKDTSALDAMDAKEKRKDSIRKFIKRQGPVKVKTTPGLATVQKEEVDLDEDAEANLHEESEYHAKPTESGARHYAMMYKSSMKRKDGHSYVGMAGYTPKDQEVTKNSSNMKKSGAIVKHKDTSKYAVGNISDKTEWHDKPEHAVAHAHKRFGFDHKHVTPEHVKVISDKDYTKHVSDNPHNK